MLKEATFSFQKLYHFLCWAYREVWIQLISAQDEWKKVSRSGKSKQTALEIGFCLHFAIWPVRNTFFHSSCINIPWQKVWNLHWSPWFPSHSLRDWELNNKLMMEWWKVKKNLFSYFIQKCHKVRQNIAIDAQSWLFFAMNHVKFRSKNLRKKYLFW